MTQRDALRGLIRQVGERKVAGELAVLCGVAAASFLGLGRALGEAIAVTQVIGAGNAIHASLFQTGDTLASRIADEYQGATTTLQISSLFYLGFMLLVIGLLANIAAQLIARRFDVRRAVAR